MVATLRGVSCPVPADLGFETRSAAFLGRSFLVALVTIPFAFVGDLGFVAELANLARLAVFVVVNASLLKLRYGGETRGTGYRAPLNVGRFSVTAFLGAVTSIGLILFYLVRAIAFGNP